MSFQPVILSNTYLGWKSLVRSQETQIEKMKSTKSVKTIVTKMSDALNNASSSQNLVTDYTVLKAVLTAFNLQDDINNRYLIKRVIDEGTEQREALANKLLDSRYKELSAAINNIIGTNDPTKKEAFIQLAAEQYLQNALQVSVGETSNDMRLALNANQELEKISRRSMTEETEWLTIIGSAPLRDVFEKALGLPSSLASLDLDRQILEFEKQLKQRFGLSYPSEIVSSGQKERFLDSFIIASTTYKNTLDSRQIALALISPNA